MKGDEPLGRLDGCHRVGQQRLLVSQDFQLHPISSVGYAPRNFTRQTTFHGSCRITAPPINPPRLRAQRPASPFGQFHPKPFHVKRISKPHTPVSRETHLKSSLQRAPPFHVKRSQTPLAPPPFRLLTLVSRPLTRPTVSRETDLKTHTSVSRETDLKTFSCLFVFFVASQATRPFHVKRFPPIGNGIHAHP